MSKVAIWMGHSGSEMGAVGLVVEDDVTRQARTWAVAYAKACGHTVTTDNDNMSLSQRINASDSSHAGILEWHVNMLGTGAAQGTEVWYSQYDKGKGQALAKAMCAKAEAIGFKNRGGKNSKDNRYGRLGILDTPSPTAVLVELFFLDNNHDVTLWHSKGKQLVESMTQAFLAGLGLKSTPDGSVPETPAPTPPSSNGPTIGGNLTSYTSWQKTDTVVNVRVSQTSKSTSLGELPQGKVFKSNRYADGEDADGNGYKWFERADGGGWVYGGYITKVPAPSSVRQIAVDGKWGKDVNTRLQEVYGTYVDGVLSHQYKSSANAYLYGAQFDGTLIGSTVIKAIQKALGLKADGLIGSDTIRAMQRHLGTYADGVISPTSNMVKVMQQRLNAGQRPF